MNTNVHKLVIDVPRKTASGEVVYDEVFIRDILSGKSEYDQYLSSLFVSILADVYAWLRIPPRGVWTNMPDSQRRVALQQMFLRYLKLVELGYPSYFIHECILSGGDHAVDE